MSYRIAICDDDAAQAGQLKSIAAQWAEAVGANCRIDCFGSAEAFWFAYKGDESFDILLLDVEMKDMDGIQLAKLLRAEGCKAEIVFITSHFEFMGEGYEVDALHYLIKPVDTDKLSAVLTRAADKLATEPSFVMIACEGDTIRLYEADILYAESFLHDLAIYTEAKQYRAKENISAFAQRLSADFFRTHRSYLVNLKAVVRISRTSVTLKNGAELPLARGKYDEINRAFIARN